MIAIFRSYYFFLAVVLSLTLAWLLRHLNLGDSSEVVTQGIIILIFLISGFGTPWARLAAALAHAKLHGLIQGMSLFALPLIVWAFDPIWALLGVSEDIRIGFLVCGVVSTTIVSCTVFTEAAGGNRGAAIVSAALGNLLGVVVAPLWLWWMLQSEAQSRALDLPSVMIKIGLLVLMPLVIGQLLRITWPRSLPELTKTGNQAAQMLLLGLLFFGFQRQFSAGVDVALTDLSVAVFGAMLLHALALSLAMVLGRLTGLSHSDRICLVICGSQKTIALGIPLITLSFAGHTGIGKIVVPILCYWILQTLVASLLVRHWRSKAPPGSH